MCHLRTSRRAGSQPKASIGELPQSPRSGLLIKNGLKGGLSCEPYACIPQPEGSKTQSAMEGSDPQFKEEEKQYTMSSEHTMTNCTVDEIPCVYCSF